jgi:hypothetical protein
MDALELHYEAAPPLLLELLRQLVQEDLLEPFHLVGGTALALQLGHRVTPHGFGSNYHTYSTQSP